MNNVSRWESNSSPDPESAFLIIIKTPAAKIQGFRSDKNKNGSNKDIMATILLCLKNLANAL